MKSADISGSAASVLILSDLTVTSSKSLDARRSYLYICLYHSAKNFSSH